jgi:thiol-disulfide isomerase/thioredoxin
MFRCSLAAAAAAALLVAGAALAVARPAPPLAGFDPVTGRHVSLAQFAGRPVVLNVWASWCEGCRSEAADLKRFAAAHRDVAMLGLDVQDSKAGARAFYRIHDLDWPSIFDPQDVLAKRLGLAGVPTTLFLDRQHRIVATIAGAGTLARFQAAFRLIRG